MEYHNGYLNRAKSLTKDLEKPLDRPIRKAPAT